MIRKILPAIVLLLTALSSAAQNNFDKIRREKPDFDQIRREINDRNSDYYYPRLMAEYERNDTLMKLDKFRYLYLGYSLQEDYNPYRQPSVSNSTAFDISRAKLTLQECDTVIKYANLALDDNPFDLNQMHVLISAYKQRHNFKMAAIWQYKFNYILMAIVSTGTGMDEENACYVIEPQHEYVLLNVMGYTVTNHLFYEPYFEYLTVVDGAGRPNGGFYFNIHHVLEEYYRKFPEEL